MTIMAWPDIPTGTGEVVKNLKMRGFYLGVTILAETVAPKNTYFYRLGIVTVFPVTHITI